MIERNLIVRGFCGIKEVNLNLRRFNVFVGPQASGKSLLAKLDYFCQEALGQMLVAAAVTGDFEEYRRLVDLKFKNYFPPKTWGKSRPFEIQSRIGDIWIYLKGSPKKGSLQLSFSDEVEFRFGRMAKRLAQLVSKFGEDRFLINGEDYYLSRYLLRMSEFVMRDEVFESLLFVPAGRSFFANLDRAVWPILQRQKSIDPFLIQYGVHYESVKGAYRRASIYSNKDERGVVNSPSRSNLWRAIGGELVIEKEDEYVKFEDGRMVPVANLSSGQQELLPLLIGVFSSSSDESRKMIYIEEPEAHLFPSAQKDVVEFIVSGFNEMSAGSGVFITTHSPYVLASINNLLAAHRVSRKRGRGRLVENIYPRQCWLDIDHLSCYAVQGGGAESIVDHEFSIIDASYIDSVSSSIAYGYEALLEINS